jgi:hypothetical protein
MISCRVPERSFRGIFAGEAVRIIVVISGKVFRVFGRP